MKLGFLVNDVNEIQPHQTTAMLIHNAAKLGHQVLVIAVGSLRVEPDKSLIGHNRSAQPGEGVAATLDNLRAASDQVLALDDLDALMIRTNPARDIRTWAHDLALEVAALLEDRGVFVANRPVALRRSLSKMMLTRLPAEVLPHTLVTRDFPRLERFVADAPGDVVLKPLSGTRGQDVFRLERDRAVNLRQIFEVLTRRGYCVAQHFVPEAMEGDVRMVMLNGQPLMHEGRIAAVRRVPSGKDFRSNIAVGGNAQPVEITDEMRAVADAIGPRLAEDGLWLIGLDLIGTKVVEVNVFSTGGLNHAELFYKAPFAASIIEWLVARVSAARASA